MIQRRVPATALPPMTDIALRLSALFPIIADGEVELRDNGNGPYIHAWNRPEPQPTEEALRAVVIPEPDLVISDLQARLWLNSAGFYEAAVQNHIDSIPDLRTREDAKVTWDRSLTIRLSSPLVQSIGAALGMSTHQLRAAFILAGEM